MHILNQNIDFIKSQFTAAPEIVSLLSKLCKFLDIDIARCFH